MDPNEALRRIRTAMRDVQAASIGRGGPHGIGYYARALSDQFQELDVWLSNGGFPPEEWREGPDAVADDDGYPWCYLCRRVFPKGADAERDEHQRREHGGHTMAAVVHQIGGAMWSAEPHLPCRECGATEGHNYPCDSVPEPLGPPDPAGAELPDRYVTGDGERHASYDAAVIHADRVARTMGQIIAIEEV